MVPPTAAGLVTPAAHPCSVVGAEAQEVAATSREPPAVVPGTGLSREDLEPPPRLLVATEGTGSTDFAGAGAGAAGRLHSTRTTAALVVMEGLRVAVVAAAVRLEVMAGSPQCVAAMAAAVVGAK